MSTTYEFAASNYLLGVRKRNMNYSRYGHGSVSLKGVVYVFGGFAHKDVPGEKPRTISTCEKLTASSNSWEMITNMNEARAFFGSCGIEN
jgi:hypothetical protein